MPGRTALPPTPPPWPVLPSSRSWPLHDAAASRRVEQAALALAEPHALMQRAGLAVARLALAVAPHAQRIHVLAGPGNNGGDGLVAARHLQQWGRAVRVTHLASPGRLPADAADALQCAQDAGVPITGALDDAGADLVIDALLGLGATRAPEGAIAQAIAQANAGGAPILAVDLPSGLDGDTGARPGPQAIHAAHTLALLTLKPGLFTAHGRDHAGRVWLSDLGCTIDEAPTAQLIGPQAAQALLWPRAHAQHKGSFGDVLVIGGAPGMGGAALLAAEAALAAGGGRVYLGRLDRAAPDAAETQAALMQRPLAELLAPARLAEATVVCGCGGGEAVHAVLPAVLAHAAQLVLDADALNAVAADTTLRARLRARAAHGRPTVLTPHPLEAARLAGGSAAQVQAARLASASRLADELACVLLLKGSGTVVSAPGQLPRLNPTGNARLGTAGSGDVLAGWIGGAWAAHGGGSGFEVACAAAWLHGRAAELAPGAAALPLPATALVAALQDAAARLAG